jgi:hypothetical protein
VIDGRKSEGIVLHDGKVPRKVLCLRRTEMGGGGRYRSVRWLEVENLTVLLPMLGCSHYGTVRWSQGPSPDSRDEKKLLIDKPSALC